MSLLWKCELISKNSFEFLKFFVNFDTVVTYHNLLLEVYVIHTRRRKITITIFFWNFGIVPATQTFLRHLHQLLLSTFYSLKTSLGWHLYSAWCSSLTFFLGSMSKGFRVLLLGNSVSDSELLKEVLELLSAICRCYFLHMLLKSKHKIYLMF